MRGMRESPPPGDATRLGDGDARVAVMIHCRVSPERTDPLHGRVARRCGNPSATKVDATGPGGVTPREVCNEGAKTPIPAATLAQVLDSVSLAFTEGVSDAGRLLRQLFGQPGRTLAQGRRTIAVVDARTWHQDLTRSCEGLPLPAWGPQPVRAHRPKAALRETCGRWPPTECVMRCPCPRSFVLLTYRYDPRAAPDGLPGVEGTFNMCSCYPRSYC